MDTLELSFPIADPALQERLIAELGDLDVDAFQQYDDRLCAYLPAARWGGAAQAELERRLAALNLPSSFEATRIPAQDWNAAWEASIRPVFAGPFLIRPSWNPGPAPPAGTIVLEIDPKMSFGTGHHESTRLALHLLASRIAPGDRVLDAGTGTGILAIAAVKLGAARVLAYDADAWVADNVHENLVRNGVAEQIAFRVGTVEVVPESDFDLVVANINRTVLLHDLPAFADRLRAGGTLILAGLLREDRDALVAATAARGLILLDEAVEHAWWAASFRREISRRLPPR